MLLRKRSRQESQNYRWDHGNPETRPNIYGPASWPIFWKDEFTHIGFVENVHM
jgi:hypothetical protein